MKNIGIYIHIPFCKKKCDYCDFISYDKRKKEHLRMAVIRVKRDEKEMLLLRERLVEAEQYITDSINKIYSNIL